MRTYYRYTCKVLVNFHGTKSKFGRTSFTFSGTQRLCVCSGGCCGIVMVRCITISYCTRSTYEKVPYFHCLVSLTSWASAKDKPSHRLNFIASILVGEARRQAATGTLQLLNVYLLWRFALNSGLPVHPQFPVKFAPTIRQQKSISRAELSFVALRWERVSENVQYCFVILPECRWTSKICIEMKITIVKRFNFDSMSLTIFNQI
jgi:hypothetical protein